MPLAHHSAASTSSPSSSLLFYPWADSDIAEEVSSYNESVENAYLSSSSLSPELSLAFESTPELSSDWTTLSWASDRSAVEGSAGGRDSGCEYRRSSAYRATINKVPSDRAVNDRSAQWMQSDDYTIPSPRVRIHPSASDNVVPTATLTPPPMSSGSNRISPAWHDSFDQAFLTPIPHPQLQNRQQTSQHQSKQHHSAQQALTYQYNPSSYRSHRRFPSDDSSLASTGPDSPFVSNQTYPQILDWDTQSVPSPHLNSSELYSTAIPDPSYTHLQQQYQQQQQQQSRQSESLAFQHQHQQRQQQEDRLWSPHPPPQDARFLLQSSQDFQQPFLQQQYPKPEHELDLPFYNPSVCTPAFQNLQITGNEALSAVLSSNLMQSSAMDPPPSSQPESRRRGNTLRGLGTPDGAQLQISANLPKLDRTVSDVYQDELYDSSNAATSAPISQHAWTDPGTATGVTSQTQSQGQSQSQSQMLSPLYRSVFNERLQEANSARSVSPANTISRERSPFRDDSEYASQGIAPGASLADTARLNAATHQMQQYVAQQQQQRNHNQQQSPSQQRNVPQAPHLPQEAGPQERQREHARELRAASVAAAAMAGAAARSGYDSPRETISPKEAQLDYDPIIPDDVDLAPLPIDSLRGATTSLNMQQPNSTGTRNTSGTVTSSAGKSSTRQGQPSATAKKSQNKFGTGSELQNQHDDAAIPDANPESHATSSSSQTTSSRRQTPMSFSSSQQSQTSSAANVPATNGFLGAQDTISQQYPFINRARRQSSSLRSAPSDMVPDFPASLTSMESTKSDSGYEQNIRPPAFASQETMSSQRSERVSPPPRPERTAANGGTYTCISPGCAGRFDSPAKLQRHRRDLHRTSLSSTIHSIEHSSSADPTTTTSTTNSAATSSHTPNRTSTPSSPNSGSASTTSRNQLPGPHKCEKINPSTGKPCNTVFSRSYDLTRHEDTIHNNRKTKVRCHLCTEEKTFSRNDALTRHMRVVHPEVEFPAPGQAGAGLGNGSRGRGRRS